MLGSESTEVHRNRPLKILVVDDEEIEREGIRYLIEYYNLPLEVLIAENGVKALEVIKHNNIDILFTDIKMPFMDGLTLANQAKLTNARLKVIIYSAYAEFEYAQKAIHINVTNYILKPINSNDFRKTMDEVVLCCREEELEIINQNHIYTGYENWLEYEKSHLLFKLINGDQSDEASDDALVKLGINLSVQYSVLLLIDLKGRYIEDKFEQFDEHMKSLGIPIEILHLNERQIVVFLTGFHEAPDRIQLERVAADIVSIIMNMNPIQPCLVFSAAIHQTEDFAKQYSKMSNVLDMKLFNEDETVYFASEEERDENVDFTFFDEFLTEIFSAIDNGKFEFAVECINKLFATMHAKESLSPLFVRYTCVNILRKVYGKMGNVNRELRKDFLRDMESMFGTGSLNQTKEFLLQHVLLLQQNANQNHESHKIIEKVVTIIESEYMNDINLKYLSDRVYLTPSYLSFLFKKKNLI